MGTSTSRIEDSVAGCPGAQNDGTFRGCPRDVGHTCFLNSTQKRIKLTLKGNCICSTKKPSEKCSD